MKKKLIKIIAVFSLIGIFCYSSNVSAVTIYFQDDFDNYVVSDPLSDYSNWTEVPYTSSPTISSDYYVSAWNSAEFYNSQEGYLDAIEYYFNSRLDSFYVSFDLFLPVPSASRSFFTFSASDGDSSIYQGYALFSCMYNDGYPFGSVTHNYTDYYEDNDIVNQLCNGDFNNVSVYFERDLLNNRTIVSSYINGDLIGTSYESPFQFGFSYVNLRSDYAYLDNFTISDTLETTPVPINGECGTANGGNFSTPPEISTLCSAESYVILPSYVETPAGWTWICGGYDGGTQAYCSADYSYDLDPTIDDVIDFDFDDFEYDFEEEDVSKNWLIDIFKFLFLPREETLQKFFTTFNNLKQKIPFGYIYLIQDKFKEVSLESTDEFALNLELLGEDYEVFSVASLKEKIGENTFNIFYNTMKALIWIVFALYLITKAQKLFNND